MIHYFNPGHETAVLNASKHYRPTAHVVKMQEDLAFLPAWYAEKEDYVLLPSLRLCRCGDNPFNQQITRIDANDFRGAGLSVDLWGISPQSVYFFEKLNKQYNLHWSVPEWKEEYRFLGSRFASHKVLALLMDEIPEIEKDILPRFLSSLEEIEKCTIAGAGKQLIKSPFSSSGRGLVWLPAGKIARSERQIIGGMLKKQSQVSIEKALDKQLDFSMHFENTPEGKMQFIGYSVFQTNAKGAYEKSLPASQEKSEKQITHFVDKDLLFRVKKTLTYVLQKIYTPYYIGNIGVDMMVYRSGNESRLHPCVEVNMRKSMGYLAIRLFEKHIHADSEGEFRIEYSPDSGAIAQIDSERRRQYPLVYENGRIKEGYFSLCPVGETTGYLASVKIT